MEDIMKRSLITAALGLAFLTVPFSDAEACTGITLKSADGCYVYSRTIEWGGSLLNSGYVVVPRGYEQQSMTPQGVNGMKFAAKYGYVGLTVEQKEFVTEGINEKGLSAGLFYFPGYGKYQEYDSANSNRSVSDFQLVSWILSSFESVVEVKENINSVIVTPLDPRSSTVHWRVADTTGAQIVIEIVDGKVNVYDNKLGVLTNSPGFEWQITNLNNYVNLRPGTASSISLGEVPVFSFGAGSGMLGLPGDVTAPSRFVRAAFYQSTAPASPTAKDAVLQCFHIMNNFDIPVGVEHGEGNSVPEGLVSATQWTTATDVANRMIYYRTVFNSTIRCIELKSINFAKVKFQYAPLDKVKEEKIEMVKIK